jgi:membrane protease YdiL (CAAX protease family)
MFNQPVILTDASATGVRPELVRDSRRLRWFELALLLSIALGPYILSGLRILITGHVSSSYTPETRWVISLLHEITALLLLGYILFRRKIQFADLGLKWSFGDLASGAAVTIGAYCSYIAGYMVVHAIHRAIFGDVSSGMTAQTIFGHPGLSAIPFFLLNPFFEELIVRAYLMTEIKELTGSATLSVAVSVIVQTTYHLYYGWERALSMGFLFLVFAVYYSRTGKATPIIVAHGAFDLVALIRLW